MATDTETNPYESNSDTLIRRDSDSDPEVDPVDGQSLTPEELERLDAEETEKLKNKYPNISGSQVGSEFLRKRLQKGPKYFDSGDYNMYKGVPGGAGRRPKQRLPVTGVIPTVETVSINLRERLPSQPSKLVDD